jgi:hypothetical protein
MTVLYHATQLSLFSSDDSSVPEGYKRCTQCGKVKPLDDFPNLDKRTLAKRPTNSKQMGKRPECKECKAEYDRAYEKRVRRHRKYNPQVDKRNHFKRHYGITQEEYQAIFNKQNGLCAICGKPETAMSRRGKPKLLAVDHDHVTGKVRALLCQGCNIGLGNYEKLKPLFAIYEAYLLQHMKRPGKS